jgi:hypothetical protein
VRRDRIVLISCLVLFAASAAGSVAAAPLGTWDLAVFLILGPLVLLGDRFEVQHTSTRVSGSAIGLLLAGAILGPTQVWLLAVLSIVVDMLCWRPRLVPTAVDFAAYGVFALAGSIVVHLVADLLDATVADAAFGLAILAGAFAGFLSAIS